MAKAKVQSTSSKKLHPKSAALSALKSLPDDASFEDMMYRLFVLQKIQRGLEDGNAGRVKTHSEVEKKFSKWLK